MEKETITTIVFVVLGLVVGYISQFIGSAKLSLVTAIIVLVVVGNIIGKVFDEGAKWWLKNGGGIYIFLWLVFWIFFFNL